jgi:hypothetical protein
MLKWLYIISSMPKSNVEKLKYVEFLIIVIVYVSFNN